jgi:hypothetical protein
MDSYTPSLADLEARLAKWEWNKVRMLRNWIVNHQRGRKRSRKGASYGSVAQA